MSFLVCGAASCQGRPLLYQGCGPLDDLSPVSNRNEVRPDLQKESSHNGCVQLWLGCPVGGQSGVRLLVSLRETPAYQLPRDAGGFLSPENLPSSLKRAPRLGPVGQHDGGGLHQSPRQPQVTHSLQDGLSPPFFGHRKNCGDLVELV